MSKIVPKLRQTGNERIASLHKLSSVKARLIRLEFTPWVKSVESNSTAPIPLSLTVVGGTTWSTTSSSALHSAFDTS